MEKEKWNEWRKKISISQKKRWRRIKIKNMIKKLTFYNQIQHKLKGDKTKW